MRIIAGLLSGIIGGMGLGGGAVLLIYLRLFTQTNQLTAQGINLLFFIPIAVFSVTIYSFKGMINWKKVFFISGFSLLGSVAGFMLSSSLGNNRLSKLFGLMLIFLGISEIVKGIGLILKKKCDILKKE